MLDKLIDTLGFEYESPRLLLAATYGLQCLVSNSCVPSNHCSQSHVILVQTQFCNFSSNFLISFHYICQYHISYSGNHINGGYMPHNDSLLCLIRYLICWNSKGSSIIVIIFTSVHSILFFVTPSPPPKSVL